MTEDVASFAEPIDEASEPSRLMIADEQLLKHTHALPEVRREATQGLHMNHGVVTRVE
jgi:hypothetical protein